MFEELFALYVVLCKAYGVPICTGSVAVRLLLEQALGACTSPEDHDALMKLHGELMDPNDTDFIVPPTNPANNPIPVKDGLTTVLSGDSKSATHALPLSCDTIDVTCSFLSMSTRVVVIRMKDRKYILCMSPEWLIQSYEDCKSEQRGNRDLLKLDILKRIQNCVPTVSLSTVDGACAYACSKKRRHFSDVLVDGRKKPKHDDNTNTTRRLSF